MGVKSLHHINGYSLIICHHGALLEILVLESLKCIFTWLKTSIVNSVYPMYCSMC